MKKIIAAILAVVIVFSSCSVLAFASGELNKDDVSEYPLIIVPGYTSSALYYGDSPETGEMVWGLNMDLVLEKVLKNIVELGVGLGAMTLGNAKIIANTLGREINDLFEKLRCNPDGSSVYELKRVVSTAEEINNANLMITHPNGDHRQEKDMAVEFAEYIGNENIFNFTCDFRMGSEACAKQLDECVQSVKEYTNKDKVNILAVSHGGQVTATYLNLYGWKGDVDNAVLTVPAIGGAGIAYDAMTANVVFDEECLIRFIQHGMRWEEDYDWLLKAQQLGFIDMILNELVPVIFDTLGYWGSLWDFIPADKYESAKKELLDPVESAALIEKSDRFHYEILPTMNEKLGECIENGMNISIISGTGNRIVTGMNEYSDGIITTKASTGATVAPYGERFADGYVQINDCGGKNKVSPDMTIDASTAYLPDNTWFVDGLFHGMTFWDDYTRVLMMTLLFTDNITDVYSDPDFPQFRDTTNPSSAVYARFSESEAGVIRGEADSLVVTNCCQKNDVRILAVSCDGIDLDFKVDPNIKLAPNESIEIPFDGEIPAVGGKAAKVTVYYVMNTITPIGYRTQTYTIENGAAVENGGGFVSSEAQTPFDDFIGNGMDSILRRLGVKELFSMIYTIVYYWTTALLNF